MISLHQNHIIAFFVAFLISQLLLNLSKIRKSVLFICNAGDVKYYFERHLGVIYFVCATIAVIFGVILFILELKSKDRSLLDLASIVVITPILAYGIIFMLYTGYLVFVTLPLAVVYLLFKAAYKYSCGRVDDLEYPLNKFCSMIVYSMYFSVLSVFLYDALWRNFLKEIHL